MIPDLETPFSRFPNTDHSAIERKDQSISAVITERQQQLNAVLQDVSGLESVMDKIKGLHRQLLEEKDKIIQSMNLHKGLVSALWRFPSELLSYIFVHCLPETEHLLPASKLAPMLLTRICRRWREVAARTSDLWCGVIVDVDDEDWQQAAFCYDSWLKRSQDRPLSLALRCFEDDATNLRTLLQPYMNRISSLQIVFVDPVTPELLLDDLPALQELTISTSYHMWRPTIAQSISRLPFTLRSLKVVGPSAFDFDRLSSFNPVWAHLTHVEIALEPFAHTNLQSLRISNASPLRMASLFPDLFNALTLPNLRVLEARYIRPWPHEELKAFLVRSGCPLESLIFGTRVMTTNEQRAEYIILVPSLEVVVDYMRGDYFGYRRLAQQYGIGRRRHVL
ncbi:uncharacterized protein EDB91DRAFT_50911 [Suillus paluster]|uniref:uncharacterized protein n=1 Tax=Suillus paluster TaxID=48578 RepID=UPI001B86A5BB|nr:uncharacterized protein EDB91DRAFT_50911 [Suillus paluster]KAG1747933.1 hypothetical protein EDB91DRAFT_50911 [Suillus paluster]